MLRKLVLFDLHAFASAALLLVLRREHRSHLLMVDKGVFLTMIEVKRPVSRIHCDSVVDE